MSVKCFGCKHLNEPSSSTHCSGCIRIAKDKFEPAEKKSEKKKEG